ncbi:MAG: LPXTG cell wall anchor domain-containing protein [Firmicutes bacterium]|nr:LPXTG cell wall anchor domain-containing protein [Bacillota bacterium]
MLKKFLLVLMALMMVFTMIPTVAMAEVNDDGVTTEFQAMLDKVLDKDGKLVLKCVKPANEDAMALLCWGGMQYFYPELYDKGFYFSPVTDSDSDYYDPEVHHITSLTSVIIGYNSEKKEVPVKYEYDSQIASDVKKFTDKFPADKSWFEVSDLELINYFINFDSTVYENPDFFVPYADPLANFSGELKKLLSNTNMFMDVIPGAGDDDTFITARVGTAFFGYGDTVYYLSDQLGARGNHVIYVPANTGDSEEALIAAAKARINNYIGSGKVDIKKAEDISIESYKAEWEESLDKNIQNAKAFLDECIAQIESIKKNDPNNTEGLAMWERNKKYAEEDLEYIKAYKIEFMNSISFLDKAAGGLTFELSITGRNDTYNFVIIKDDAKLAVPTYASADLKTDVAVATSSSQIPLDTMIEVKNVTSGTEYDRIMKVLDVENSKTFDIKLHSASKDDYVTKLDNGKFEVKIPIDKQFEGKNLVVYYVDAKGNTTEHAVTVKGGFATFETDHFSIYTLAEAKGSSAPKEEIKVDGGKAEVPADVIKDASAADKAEVVITVPKDKEVAEITLPVASVKEVASAKKSLTIETKTATVTLDSKALETFVDKADGAKITLKIDEIAKTALSEKQQKAIENMDFDVIISAEILCEDKVISEDFGGGKATIELPFTPAEGKKLGDYTIVYIDNNGNLFRIPTKVADGNLVFEIEHFSEYAVALSSEVANIPLAGSTPKTGDASGLAGWAMLAVLAAGTAVFAKRRRED